MITGDTPQPKLSVTGTQKEQDTGRAKKKLLEDLIQTISSYNFNMRFIPKSNNKTMKKILFACQIHLSLMKNTI